MRKSDGDRSGQLSLWEDSITRPDIRTRHISGSTQTEALIVGGGLCGILTAWSLQNAGTECLVVDAGAVGGGVTRNTTGKITAQHGLVYADLIKRFGLDRARLYYEANSEAIRSFEGLAEEYPCDFERKTACVYSVADGAKLEREAAAYKKLGIPGGLSNAAFPPFKTAGAVAMEGQAQFNPMLLLSGLSEKLNISENTLVTDIEKGRAITDRGTVEARHIVLCSHYPLINIPGLYFLKLYQHRSYVLALENAPLPDGMYVDERQDGHSFRSCGDLLLLGGGDHKTGREGGGWRELEELAKREYPQARIRYRWAAQDCMSLDAVPYIGKHRSSDESLYVATGFNKWGMTGSMVASRLITELITEGKSPLEELYSPRRSIWTGNLGANIGSAAAGLLTPGGPRCTHMGCKLRRNSQENTWECSCHGSRYDMQGAVLDGPAKRGKRFE